MREAGTPENLLDRDDPGDDTQRRFRYQATYAALKALAMLEEEPEIAYIFCEHWEDILVKRSDGQFVGIQIKTRATGKDPFKTNDEDIVNSLKRFIRLEKTFPGDFARYVIAANCGFWQVRKNSSNLRYLLEIASTSSLEKALDNSCLLQLVRKLAKLTKEEASCVVRTLQKIVCEDSPGLDDVESRLYRALARCSQVKHLESHQVLRVADTLTNLMSKAAALPRSSQREEYLVLLKNPEQEQANLTIQAKKISVEQVLEVVNLDVAVASSSQSTVLLTTYNHPSLSDLPEGMRRMELKMTVGGISVGNIDLAKTHKFSTEYLLNQWLFKHGFQKAESRYQHLRNIIWTECREAHDSVYTESFPFGTDMLKELRARLRDRYNRDKQHFFECTYEHLCGFVGILTEECLVWWSPEFEIPEEGV